MEELLRDGDYDMFTAFGRDGPAFDTKQILSKLNSELRVDEDSNQQSVLAMLESQIQ